MWKGFTSVCHSVHKGGGCLPLGPEGCTTPWADPPRADTPLWVDTPLSRFPNLGRHPPYGRCSRWYASYWNALERSCGQGYVFTRVCDSVHRGVSGEPPLDQADPTPPPQDKGEPPRPGRPPPLGPRRTPSDQGRRLQHMVISSRYASYWNAFLFCLRFSASAFTYGREKKSVTLLHVKEMFLSLTIIEKMCTGCQLIYYCIIRLCHRQRVLASNFFRVRYRLCTYCALSLAMVIYILQTSE